MEPEKALNVRNLLNRYRYRLTEYESVLAYSLLGVVGGLASGLVVLAFDFAVRQLGNLAGAGGQADGFEALDPLLRFALPAGGAALLGLAYTLLRPADRETGIVHVISRMHSHYSVLPLRNAVVQFIGGAFALATGQSGGREGPGVHLGGAANSLLGQWLGLPNNSLRVLIACGTAGGIAAVFQTPLAGVIFAMEVIVAEYTLVGFIPVMLAAVAASAVSVWLASDNLLFALPPLRLNSLLELPYLVLLGLLCGLAVAAFIRISALAARFAHWPVLLRFTLAGCVTGALALLVPQVPGMGYDTLDLALHGRVAAAALLAIAGCKLVATALSCGVGMPIGVIGPNLLIGACLGGALGTYGALLFPDLASDPALYIVIGMGSAMGAALSAPLAALLAVIELTQNIGISMAAMLAIVTATLTNSGLFRQRSAHQSVLLQLERRVPGDPLNQLLHRSNVNSTMDTRVVRVPHLLGADDLEPLLESTPAWCLVQREGEDLYLVDGAELLEWLSGQRLEEGAVDLTGTDLRRRSFAAVPMQATLRQAADTMREQTTEAVCVFDRSPTTGHLILQGVVTRESIERFSLGSL